jgi:hypothetical protein
MIEVRYNFPGIVAAFTLDEEDAKVQCRGSVARLAIEHVEYGVKAGGDGSDSVIVEIVPATHKIVGVEHRLQFRIL